MLKRTFFIIGILISVASPAQDNLVYTELGGNGLGVSINYERKLMSGLELYPHIGLGSYLIKGEVTVPFGINYLFRLGKQRNYIDLGAGLTYTKADVKLYSIVEWRNRPVHIRHFNFIPSLGYRSHTRKNWMYRFSFTLVFNQYDGLPFAGFSIGKLF